MTTQTNSISKMPFVKPTVRASKTKKILLALFRDRYLYLLAIPGILYFLIFKFVPMWGLIISFQNYSPFLGILHSPWVGFEHFQRLFGNEDFKIIFRNTLAISFLNLLLFFPAPIVLSLLLNEVSSSVYKRWIQTVIYFPHFLSWVIIAGITFIMLGQADGLVNEIIAYFGGEKIAFLSEPKTFWLLLVVQNIWRDAGWGTVIFLAAITSVDPALYESARMDGANRFRQIWHITLPGIKNVIIVLLILRIGQVMEVGFEQIYLMSNAPVASLADVFDTYVYRNGVRAGQFSYSAAVGLFKSVIGLIMVLLANRLAKMFGEEGVY
ncbi:ABC transporter permease [Paenibacillus roseipurpureus]|uniref:Sugar ABC transporter permease n=1 Tax=Paenibacillus roseopurpureus TaxID=2918901 RepID=A0AA96LU29_9BACL|nr:sugar ABC transporter permease [Paenibacillus sp. MBLB1832]WNR46063.1 sugar ABC transporter permease [Paenibacillus sp. MBLB1832]